MSCFTPWAFASLCSAIAAVGADSVRSDRSILHRRQEPQPPRFSTDLQYVTRSLSFEPGQRAPPLQLPTLSGILDTADLLGAPVIFHAYVPDWGFSDALWKLNISIQDLLVRAPPNAHFVFLSYALSPSGSSVNATSVVEDLQTLFHKHISGTRGKHLHFVARSVEELAADSATAWVPKLLQQYPTFFDIAEANIDHAHFAVPMLNSRYDWLGWAFTPSKVFGSDPIKIVDIGDGCSSLSPDRNLTGQLALAIAGGCDYYRKAKSAALMNASGVAVIAPSESSPLESMNCVGEECDDQSLGLSAFMIEYSQGVRLRHALSSGRKVSLQFSMNSSKGTDFGLDASGRIYQTWGGSGLGNAADHTYGNPGDVACKLYPTFAFLAWAAQWLNFQQSVAAQLSIPSHVVKVFNQTHMRPSDGDCYGSDPWGCGPSAIVAVPAARSNGSLGHGYDKLELDFALGCGNGMRDVDCPQWDHVISLLACCGQLSNKKLESFTCDASMGFEMGRWITSFSRGVGHWVTDVSFLLPLLSGDGDGARACNLTIFTTPWAGNNGAIPWTASLNLRFLEPAATPVFTPVKVLQPWSLVSTSVGGVYQLFRWISFNQSYESYFPPFHFDVSPEIARATMTVTLSGHGNDNHGCGEFCSTSHHFTLNGHTNVKYNNDPENAELGCADKVVQGTTPNEYGTWLYGRDGWCDGNAVAPWSVDVTTQLQPGANVLRYRGLFNGSIPDPSSLQQGAPVMMMRLYITLYTRNPSSNEEFSMGLVI